MGKWGKRKPHLNTNRKISDVCNIRQFSWRITLANIQKNIACRTVCTAIDTMRTLLKNVLLSHEENGKTHFGHFRKTNDCINQNQNFGLHKKANPNEGTNIKKKKHRTREKVDRSHCCHTSTTLSMQPETAENARI